MKKIFVDTSAWIALADRDDRNHLKAVNSHIRNLEYKVKYVISNLVLFETITRLRYNLSHSAALKFKKEIDAAIHCGDLQIIWVNSELADEAWNIFSKFKDQKFSFVDCTSFVIARKEKLDGVFAFDDDFRVMRFNLFP